MSWDYGMGYGYGSGGGYDADAEYEEQDQYEEQPQQRQRQTGKGLRAYAQRVNKENQDLKRRLAEVEEANRDLMGQDPQMPGAPQNGGPQAGGQRPLFASDAEAMQFQHMLAQGVVGVAPSMGTQAEQIARIRNARSPEELTEYLRSQGTPLGQNYEGMGY